jgi:hypothetical protein
MFLGFILSTRLGRRRGLILTTILLALYVIIAGASAAVVRAGLMGFLVVLGKWISRKAYMLNVFLLTDSIFFLQPVTAKMVLAIAIYVYLKKLVISGAYL